MEDFRRTLRQREWEASARRANSGKKVSISGLQDLLSEGLACGAGDTEPFLKLDEWHSKAVQWRTDVAGVLKDLEFSEEVLTKPL